MQSYNITAMPVKVDSGFIIAHHINMRIIFLNRVCETKDKLFSPSKTTFIFNKTIAQKFFLLFVLIGATVGRL